MVKSLIISHVSDLSGVVVVENDEPKFRVQINFDT